MYGGQFETSRISKSLNLEKTCVRSLFAEVIPCSHNDMAAGADPGFGTGGGQGDHISVMEGKEWF